MTFFHGTAAIFESFNTDSRGALTDYPGADLATFFAANRADAAFYADKSAAWHDGQDLAHDRRIIVASIDLSGALVADEDMVEIDGEKISIDDDRAILRAARAAGFTAVHFPLGNANNAGATVAVVDLSIVTVA
jgi:hypothetical protein